MRPGFESKDRAIGDAKKEGQKAPAWSKHCPGTGCFWFLPLKQPYPGPNQINCSPQGQEAVPKTEVLEQLPLTKTFVLV
jgi:hypothetical protein